MQNQKIDKQQAGEKLIRVVAFTLIISVMNATMFNIALPSIAQEFTLTASQVSWVVTAYIIIYAVGSVTYGKLADKFPLKDLLTIGFTLFALGSLVGFAATEFWMIILGRVLQSMGASVIPATAMVIPIRYFSPATRGRALGITSSGLALGAAIGPVVAGLVTTLSDWRYLFGLSLMVLLTLPYYRKYLDSETGNDGSIDLLGGSLLAVTITFFLLGITKGSLILSLVGLVLLFLFLMRIKQAREPFIAPSLFLNKQYSIALLVSFLTNAVSFGIPFLIPQMLAGLNHLSPAWIGFTLFPGAIIASLLGRTGGKLADKKGNVFLVTLAAALQFSSFFLLSISAGLSHLIIIWFLILGNIGQTFIQIGLSNTVSSTLSKGQAGVGMGLYMMFNFIAGAIATTVYGKVLDSQGTDIQWNPLLINHDAALFSNIFFVLTLMVIMITAVFILQFGHRKKQKELDPKLDVKKA